MNMSTRNYINDLAQQVIETYNITIPITNIENIVRHMGGTIEEKHNFDALYEGTIIKEGNSSFRIVISPHQNQQRKSFTIAHELGHLFLHMGFRTDLDVWCKQDQTVYRRFGRSDQEYQANEFAAALLMPKEVYREVLFSYASNNRVDMRKVAQHFNVSLAAAVNRGKFLGYLA
jgi:Zn-dependent peptidase ImmA (M78 family)